MVQGKAAGWPNNWPVWKVSNLTAAKGGVEKEIITVAPVPFFTVMDGLDEDLHAIDLLERFVSMQDAHTEPYLINAIALVEAALVRYNATGPSGNIDFSLYVPFLFFLSHDIFFHLTVKTGLHNPLLNFAIQF